MVIDFDIFALLGLILIFGAVGWYLKKKKGKNRIFLIFYGFFCVYLTALYSNVLFPLAYIGHDYPPNIWHSFNCIPFVGILKWESLMNLGMLIPFGFGIPFMRKIPNAKGIIPFLLVPGFMIELIQFLSALASAGYTWRMIDINDWLCYGLGIGLGYLIFRLVASLILDMFPDEPEGETPANFVWQIFRRSTPSPQRETFGDEGY